MYLCASVNDAGSCELWVPYTGMLPPLSVADALTIAGLALGVWALAWGARLVAGQLLGR